MAMNGKLLARARNVLEQRRIGNEQALEARRTEIYALLPTVREIERDLNRLLIGISLSALQRGENISAALDSVRVRASDLEARRAKLLLSAGYPADYIDEKPICSLCGDSGFVNGQVCACLTELYENELKKDLSSLPGAGDESFDNFDLTYYSAERRGEKGRSPRERMRVNLDICRDYARTFHSKSVNLLFQGDTGLGKTYLSVCIARAVATKGFSVVYDTAVSALGRFEAQRFGRDSGESFEAADQIRRYMECDLLLLDDLGTEMPGGFSASAVYTLLNTRLVAGKPMVISTNLDYDELRRRYTPQIVSRLEGEFLNLSFAGSDIRLQKKERGLA